MASTTPPLEMFQAVHGREKADGSAMVLRCGVRAVPRAGGVFQPRDCITPLPDVVD